MGTLTPDEMAGNDKEPLTLEKLLERIEDLEAEIRGLKEREADIMYSIKILQREMERL